MVTVSDYQKRTTKEGDEFYVLILRGGVESVQSKSGKMYFTTKKCSVSTTFDENTCQSVIGCQFPGTIEKVKCEPYQFEIDDDTTITLDYAWQYVDNTEEMVGEQVVEEAEVI